MDRHRDPALRRGRRCVRVLRRHRAQPDRRLGLRRDQPGRRRRTRTSTSWQADTERLAPDGAGGLWVTADDTAASGGSVVGHLSAGGQLSWIPVSDGSGTGISDVAAALGPGQGPGLVWLSGGFVTSAGGDAAVWSRPDYWRAGETVGGDASVSAVRAR